MATLSEALQLAVAHHESGRLDLAEELYRRVLAVEPDQPDALHLLGLLAHQTGRPEMAIEHIGRAIALRPGAGVYYNNLGYVRQAQRELAEAVACFGRAAELQPQRADFLHNLGTALLAVGRPADAAAALRGSLAIAPERCQTCLSLGNALLDLGLPDQAVECFRQVLAMLPESVEARGNLAFALAGQGQIVEALDGYRQAIASHPERSELWSNLLYWLHFCPGYSGRQIRDAHAPWNERHAAPLAGELGPAPHQRSPDRRLRIGYVSPDFRGHAQSFFTVPLFSAHDHLRFEVFCYSDVSLPDATTARLRSYADVWRDVARLSDAELAAQIRADRIDVLVDLTMHMARNRLLVFARRPAAVQLCWLAYPSTTGLRAMDYRITDPYLDPPGENDDCYTEHSLRLPETFWCYDPLTAGPAVGELPCLTAGHVTFGCLNNLAKVNVGVLELWARVLNRVSDARLLLLAAEGSPRQRIASFLAERGVAADRLSFVSKQPRAEYLALYHGVDIGLETFPANGHTTSLDAFWMGVPVPTLIGSTAIGRGGVSILSNLGLTGLVASDAEQYVEIMAALAEDRPRLQELRATARQRMHGSPLMDAARFARHFEAAIRTAWQRWCRA